MRREVLLLVCLVLGTMAEQCQDEGVSDEELETQGLRLETLKEELADYQSAVNSRIATANEVDSQISTLKKRLGKMKDSGCDDRFEMQCGGDMPRCISRLIICDKFSDCPNAHDEDECRVFTPAGSIWDATYEYDHCTNRKPRTMRISIDSYKVVNYMRSFPEVEATAEFEVGTGDYDPDSSLKITGWMDLKPGAHVLYFEPPETDGLAVSCVFDGVDDDICHGKVLHESSQNTCAEFFMRRVDGHN